MPIAAGSALDPCRFRAPSPVEVPLKEFAQRVMAPAAVWRLSPAFTTCRSVEPSPGGQGPYGRRRRRVWLIRLPSVWEVHWPPGSLN